MSCKIVEKLIDVWVNLMLPVCVTKKRKPVVRINDDQLVSTPAASQTATPGASSLNSSTSSVNNASSYQQKSILRPPTSYNNQHRRNTYNTYNRNRSSFTNNSIFNPYNNWLPSINMQIFNIRSDKPIYKVGKRVFLYDSIDCDETF